MKNRFLPILVTMFFVLAMVSPAMAARDYQGKPSKHEAENTMGYYIWQEGTRWNVRTVNAGTQHLFTGTVETDGTFSDVTVLQSEKVERVAMSVRNDKLEFHINSAAKTDGFSFTASSGQNVTFTLYADGMPVDPSNIYFGSGNRHPNSSSFSVRLNDDSSGNTNNYKNNNDNSNYNQNDSSRFQGQPSALNPGNAFGYFLWQDQNRWYLQTTTTGAERQFRGVIETDGTFSEVEKMRSMRAEGAVVDISGNKIEFTFKTGGSASGITLSFPEGLKMNQADKLSGLSFRTADGARIYFTLYVDGGDIDPSNIYIGSSNLHPSSNVIQVNSRY